MENTHQLKTHMSKICVNLDWYDKGGFGFGQHEFNGRLTCLQIDVHFLFSILISWEGYDPNLKVYFWISYFLLWNWFPLYKFDILKLKKLVFFKIHSKLFFNHGGKLIFLLSILEELNFVVVGTFSIRCLISWRV